LIDRDATMGMAAMLSLEGANILVANKGLDEEGVSRSVAFELHD